MSSRGKVLPSIMRVLQANPGWIGTADDAAATILPKLVEGGVECSTESFSPSLSALHKLGMLDRVQMRPEGGVRVVWHYSISEKGRAWKGELLSLADETRRQMAEKVRADAVAEVAATEKARTVREQFEEKRPKATVLQPALNFEPAKPAAQPPKPPSALVVNGRGFATVADARAMYVALHAIFGGGK